MSGMLAFFLFIVVAGLFAWAWSLQIGLGTARRRLARMEGEIEALRRAGTRPAARAAAVAEGEAEVSGAPDETPVAEPPASAEAGAEAGAEAPEPDRRKMPWEEGYDPAVDRPEPPEPAAPRAPGMGERLVAWLQQNWFYAVSALSLALAGLFLVQYGIEQGYLTPQMRVAAALAFGAVLIGAGEWIRRRFGDGEESATAYLPSTFSGAGIVSLYGGVLAARVLYGLIGAGTALAGLVAVSAGALLLGWLYGPFLAAIGLIGAGAAPFLVEGDAGSANLFYAYYGLLGIAGLGIDAWRRWAWVSVLALAVAAAGGLAVHGASGEMPGFAVLLAVLALAAMAVPRLEIGPAHGGGAPLMRAGLFGEGAESEPVGFPTWLAWATLAAVSALLLLLPRSGPGELLLTAGLLAGLVLAVTVWAWQARALAECALFPALGFLLLIPLESFTGTVLMRATETGIDGAVLPVVPLEATLLVVMAALVSAAAAWRSLAVPAQGAGRQLYWGLVAALFAPMVPLLIELFWLGPRVPGSFGWAGHALALAALMVGIATRFAAADGPRRRRAAWAALSAMALIALALFVILTKSALTVALAMLLVAAAALDRRFRLPEMQIFIAAGVVTLGWRVVVDPGLPWAFEASWGGFVLGFAAALAGLALAWALLPEEKRETARAFLESGFLMIGGIFLTAALWRWIDETLPGSDPGAHWSIGLTATVWLLACFAQVWRMRLGGRLRYVRIALAGVYAVVAMAFLVLLLTFSNPFLSNGGFSMPDTTIHGALILDTLAVGYLVPALALAAIARIARGRWRVLPMVGATGLAAFWAFLEIRRFWLAGEVYVGLGWRDGELYTYTVALILAGAVLLWQAIAKGSTPLRRLALAVIGVAVVKVFLVDARGLTGLFRVFSFLALGLSLAALAWLNRWAAQEAAERGAGEAGQS